MHSIETYRFFGAPHCFTVFPLLEPFSTPFYILSCFFSLILTIGSYNHTNTHISQLKTCVTDYYLIVTPSPACKYPNIDPHPSQCAPVLPRKTYPQDRPFQGLTKTPQFEESKSHMEEAGTIQNIWKTIHTGSSKARHQELAPHILGSHALPFHAIEGTWVWKVMLFLQRVETSRERTSFEDAHPGRISFSQYLRWYPKYIRSELFPLWKKYRLPPMKQICPRCFFKNIVQLSGNGQIRLWNERFR